MLKKTLFTLVALFYVFMLSAQSTLTCTPAVAYKDSTFGVYPRPYDAKTNPNGGITQCAFVNKDYNFVLTAKVPDTLNLTVPVLGPQKLKLTSIAIATTGAVQGLPAGMTYACNPPDCIFKANTLGCLVIGGKPTSANAIGDYNLKLTMTVNSNFVLAPTLPISFPDANNPIPGFTGAYVIRLAAENATDCKPFSTANDEVFASNFSVRTTPNPFNDFTTITINAIENDVLNFRLFDMTGRMILSSKFNVISGSNTFQIDRGGLSEGFYVYTLSNKYGQLSNKLLITK